jgi:hypothetical protein
VRLGAFVGVLFAGVLVLGRASADPQWNSGLVLGAAGDGTDRFWGDTQFYGALRGDLLLGRTGPRTVGFGPALEIGTLGFSDARFLLNATAVVPLGDLFVLQGGPGAYARLGSFGAVPGLSGRVLLGAKAYNDYGAYAMTGGLVLGYDHDLGHTRAHAVVVALQVDGLLLAIPALALFEWLRGPRS